MTILFRYGYLFARIRHFLIFHEGLDEGTVVRWITNFDAQVQSRFEGQISSRYPGTVYRLYIITYMNLLLVNIIKY